MIPSWKLDPRLYYLYGFRACIICIGSAPVLSVFVLRLYYLYWFRACIICIGSAPVLSVLVPRLYYLYWFRACTICFGSAPVLSLWSTHLFVHAVTVICPLHPPSVLCTGFYCTSCKWIDKTEFLYWWDVLDVYNIYWKKTKPNYRWRVGVDGWWYWHFITWLIFPMSLISIFHSD